MPRAELNSQNYNLRSELPIQEFRSFSRQERFHHSSVWILVGKTAGFAYSASINFDRGPFLIKKRKEHVSRGSSLIHNWVKLFSKEHSLSKIFFLISHANIVHIVMKYETYMSKKKGIKYVGAFKYYRSYF